MDDRRKRLKFQANHRGMKEMDLILGAFADATLPDLTDDQLDQFETLLQCPDQDLFAWMIGKEPLPDEFNNEIMQMIQNFQFPGKGK